MRIVRSAPIPSKLDIRTGDDGLSDHEVVVEGLAVPWNTPTKLFDTVFEQFEPGSIPDEAMRTQYPARLNLGHKWDRPVANIAQDTLEFEDAEEGLRMRAVVDIRDPDAQSLVVKVERQDYSNLSIEFDDDGPNYEESRILLEESDDLPEGGILYSIKQVGRFYGVAALPFGAYPTTEVGITTKSRRSAQEKVRSTARDLRDKHEFANLETERSRTESMRLRLAMEKRA